MKHKTLILMATAALSFNSLAHAEEQLTEAPTEEAMALELQNDSIDQGGITHQLISEDGEITDITEEVEENSKAYQERNNNQVSSENTEILEVASDPSFTGLDEIDIED